MPNPPVSLSSPATPTVVTDVLRLVAAALRVDASSAEVTHTETSTSIDFPAALEAPHFAVSIAFTITAQDLVSHLRARVSYQIVPLADAPHRTRAHVSSDARLVQDATPSDVAARVLAMVDTARVQRRADQLVNRPQQDAAARDARGHRASEDIVHIAVSALDGQPALEIVDRRARAYRPVTLAVDPHTGAVTSGVVATEYGTLHLRDDDLPRVARRVEYSIATALGRPVAHGTATDDTREPALLQELFRGILSGR